MEWLHARWRAFEIPYGFIEFDEADIRELEARFSDDQVGQILLKKSMQPKHMLKARGINLVCRSPSS
jgi:hypothetical protein